MRHPCVEYSFIILDTIVPYVFTIALSERLDIQDDNMKSDARKNFLSSTTYDRIFKTFLSIPEVFEITCDRQVFNILLYET